MLDLPTNERPLPLRRRPDITTRLRGTRRGREWICKDPVRRRYYSLSEIEHALWRMLDGRISLAEIKRRFAREFAPRHLETGQFTMFLARLFRQELIVSTTAGQGLQLAERAALRRWQQLATMPFQLLAIRFRGVDPDAFLTRLLPYLRWLFHPLIGWLLAGLVAIAASVAFVSRHQLAAELPRLTDFFQADNLLLLGLALAMIKVLHELGHAFTCKVLGGEVRELGVMLLFFSPCLYCDVSDAWLFPRRWQRLAVSAAGIVVEVALAALATLVWQGTQPGWLHGFCLQVMIVCGISTLLINGNPLMRYDGYYLLSDAMELPNLDERARTRLRGWFAALFLGIALPRESPERERQATFVTLYAILSTTYRWLLLVSVLWMMHAALRPLRLEFFAYLVAAVCLAGVIAMPIIETVQQLRNPFFWQRLSLRQLLARGSVFGALFAGLALIPLPCRIAGLGIVESSQTQLIYATAPGELVTALPSGTPVRARDVVIQLDSPASRLEVARLTAEVQRLEVRVSSLETLRGIDPDAASDIPTAQKTLDDAREQLRQRTSELAQLTLVAQQAGRFIETAKRTEPTSTSQQLPQWSASLLDAANRGAHVEVGTLLAQIVDPTALEVRLLLDQANIGLIAPGQTAYVSLWQAPGKLVRGEVKEVSRVQVEEVPPVLAASGEILMQPTIDGQQTPLTPQYQVRIVLEELPEHPVYGGRCTARVVVAPQSLAARALRYWRQTFGRS